MYNIDNIYSVRMSSDIIWVFKVNTYQSIFRKKKFCYLGRLYSGGVYNKL